MPLVVCPVVQADLDLKFCLSLVLHSNAERQISMRERRTSDDHREIIPLMSKLSGMAWMLDGRGTVRESVGSFRAGGRAGGRAAYAPLSPRAFAARNLVPSLPAAIRIWWHNSPQSLLPRDPRVSKSANDTIGRK
jgi:hypothetical protein